jgi:hypothetical protein
MAHTGADLYVYAHVNTINKRPHIPELYFCALRLHLHARNFLARHFNTVLVTETNANPNPQPGRAENQSGSAGNPGTLCRCQPSKMAFVCIHQAYIQNSHFISRAQWCWFFWNRSLCSPFGSYL